MTSTDLLTGVAIVVGLVGVVVPLLPGSLLVWAAVLVWSIDTATTIGWTVLATVTLVLVVGAVVKYAVPGRRLKAGGVPRRTLLAGALLGVVGFFVVPVVGLLIGFVLGVYLSELQRVGGDRAWPATMAALRAVGLSLLIELAAALVAAAAWLLGTVLT
jgi:uncharacterized protein YqgC (DUF456 family)